jgi:hypothetical protein
MKAKDLIAKLAELDPETDILTSDCCYGLDLAVEVIPIKYHLDTFDDPKEFEDWMSEPEHLDWLWDGKLPDLKLGCKIQ